MENNQWHPPPGKSRIQRPKSIQEREASFPPPRSETAAAPPGKGHRRRDHPASNNDNWGRCKYGRPEMPGVQQQRRTTGRFLMSPLRSHGRKTRVHSGRQGGGHRHRTEARSSRWHGGHRHGTRVRNSRADKRRRTGRDSRQRGQRTAARQLKHHHPHGQHSIARPRAGAHPSHWPRAGVTQGSHEARTRAKAEAGETRPVAVARDRPNRRSGGMLW